MRKHGDKYFTAVPPCNFERLQRSTVQHEIQLKMSFVELGLSERITKKHVFSRFEARSARRCTIIIDSPDAM